jgi:GT2 family glycosyltransferase
VHTPRIDVVVLSWNRREDTLRCLRSLRSATYPHLGLVVVDNGSADGSPDAVASEVAEAVLVRLDENHGFSGGVNAGIRTALERGADGVVLLNNDMAVEPGFVEPLVAASAADPQAAAVCSQILFLDPPDRVWYAGSPFRHGRGYHGRNTGFGGPPLPAATRPYATDCLCGGAVLLTRAALEHVGLFDEDLFAYREDLDWSLRAREAGLRVLVAPASVVRHSVSASSGGESSPAPLYYDVRNLLTVSERHDRVGALRTLLRRLEAVAAHAAQALGSRRRTAGLRAVYEGWRDFRAGRLGPRR